MWLRPPLEPPPGPLPPSMPSAPVPAWHEKQFRALPDDAPLVPCMKVSIVALFRTLVPTCWPPVPGLVPPAVQVAPISRYRSRMSALAPAAAIRELMLLFIEMTSVFEAAALG